MIEIKNLTKVYGDHTAVSDLSLKLANGKIYGLLGPNGAGKSTTMNMMTGALAPTSGTVKINGFDIFLQPVKAKLQIGYLPEQPPLYGDMTPEEYLTFVAEVKGVSPERVARQVAEVMELTDVSEHKDRLIKHLSKGFCQRVGIAQAMLGNPDIIILDEPTVGLDPKQLQEIRALIASLGEKRTVIISSHILAEISEICDELIVLADGALVAQGTQEELESLLGESAVLRLSVRGDEAGVLAVLDSIAGVTDRAVISTDKEGTVMLSVSVPRDRDVRDDIFFAMAERRYAVLGMEMEQKTLESVFLALTDESAKAASGEMEQSTTPAAVSETEDEANAGNL